MLLPVGPRPAGVVPTTLAQLAERWDLRAEAPLPPLPVTGITHDSRAVRAGDLYAALPGQRAHGADFARQAAVRGAVGVLTDPAGAARVRDAGLAALVSDDPRGRLGAISAHVYGHPSEALLTLGVTGTNGKTTTAYLLDAGLRAAGRTTGLLGTVETRVGQARLASARTTPEAPDLQALLAVMRERGASAVSLEVSSHALVLGRVDGLVLDVAGFTGLSQDHLDFHRTMEDYFAAKAELFTPARARRGVVVVDDDWGRQLVRRAKKAGLGVATVSAAERTSGPTATWRALDVVAGPTGSTFTVAGPGRLRVPASVRLPGAFNVANALLAVAMLAEAGVPVEAAVAGVADCAGVPGRMERVDVLPCTGASGVTGVVDFAHTPRAVERLLSALREVTAGRLVVVLGCGGDRDAEKRPLMGAAAAELADLAVLTSDNPRSEDPAAILAAMEAGARAVPAPRRAELVVELDRAAAIRRAVQSARPGDTVVVAGKGHEQGQEAQGVVRPFDDRVVLRDALADRVGGS